jgi:cytochrome c-type biogenesis protein CcmF
MFMGIGPRIRWIKNNFDNLKKTVTIILLALGLNFLIFFLFKSYSVLSNLIIISSIFLILYSLSDLYISFIKKTGHNLPQVISHLSFGFLVFFIGLNHIYSTEIDFNLKVGEKKNFESYEVRFDSLDLENRKNYKAIIGTFFIQEINVNNENILKPEIRIYNQPETLTYEASIKSRVKSDLYLTMSNLNQSEYYNLKFQNKPFMIWIWVSALCIALGGFFRLFKGR